MAYSFNRFFNILQKDTTISRKKLHSANGRKLSSERGLQHYVNHIILGLYVIKKLLKNYIM
jgi:hypothetical protein